MAVSSRCCNVCKCVSSRCQRTRGFKRVRALAACCTRRVRSCTLFCQPFSSCNSRSSTYCCRASTSRCGSRRTRQVMRCSSAVCACRAYAGSQSACGPGAPGVAAATPLHSLPPAQRCRGGWGTQVSHKIGNGVIDFMPHRRNNRDLRSGDGATTFSSLKAQRSSSEPPPRPTITRPLGTPGI